MEGSIRVRESVLFIAKHLNFHVQACNIKGRLLLKER